MFIDFITALIICLAYLSVWNRTIHWIIVVAIVTNVLKQECVNTGSKSEIGNVVCWSKDWYCGCLDNSRYMLLN